MNFSFRNFVTTGVLSSAIIVFPAFGQEVSGINFDLGLNSKSFVRQINDAEIEIPSGTESEDTTKSNSSSPNASDDRIISVKEALNSLSEENRLMLVSEMRWVNGKVVSINLALLRQAGISLNDLQAFGPLAASSAPAQGNSLSELLANVSKESRMDFIDNIELLNGVVVSVKHNVLETEIGPNKLKNVLDVIMSGKTSKSGSRGISKNYKCQIWITPDPKNSEARQSLKQIDKSCVYSKGNTCNEDTCK